MKGIFFIAGFFTVFFCAAQKDTGFRLLKTYPFSASEILIDNLENIYLLSASGQLKKYNANGDSAGIFNEVRRFGKPFSVDVTNPLRPLLFYKDFSTIVLLDRQLSIRGTVDLRSQNIMQATAAAVSYDNNIWLFDAVENKLKKIDESGKLLLETVDLRNVFEEGLSPEKIIDQNNSVYLFDSLRGLFQFDHFGSFQKKHAVTGWTNIALIRDRIVGIKNNELLLLNPSNFVIKNYQFPSSFGSFQQYIIGNGKLFTLSKDSVRLYSFPF